jgi:hypothetical protein
MRSKRRYAHFLEESGIKRLVYSCESEMGTRAVVGIPFAELEKNTSIVTLGNFTIVRAGLNSYTISKLRSPEFRSQNGVHYSFRMPFGTSGTTGGLSQMYVISL